MKRILALICSFVLALSAMSGVAANAASTGATMHIGSVTGAAGETVEVQVTLENNPGINSVVVEIDYDETRLTLLSAVIGETFSTGGAFTNVNLPYVTFVRSNNVAEDGVLMTLTFAINSGATSGDAYVTILYEEGDITNYDEDDVNFEVVPGKVVVGDSLYGDVNGDGAVDSDDAALICYYDAELIDADDLLLSVGDVTGDGRVDSDDAALICYMDAEIIDYSEFPCFKK